MIRRRTVWLIALLVLVTLASVGAAVVAFLPDIVRRTAIWRLEALTARRVDIDRVELSLLTGRLAVHGLRIAEAEGGGTLARVDRIEGRIRRRSLWTLRVWLEELTITGTQVRVIRLSPTRFNISDLLDRPAERRAAVPVTIDRLRVADSAFFFEDRTLRPARTWAVERIAIEAENLSSRDTGGRLELRSVAAGAPLHVLADELRLVPFRVRARITAANLDLGLLRLYLPGDAAVLPDRGVLAAGVTVVHDVLEGIRIDAGARVRNVVLERRGQDDAFATSPEVTIALNDLVIKDGRFSLRRAEVEGDLAVMEAVHDPPRRYALRGTRLVVEELAWPSGQPGRVSFSGALPDGAGLDVRGTLTSEPLRADLRVRALRLPLDLANRYARLTGTLGGVVDVDTRLVATRPGGRLRLTASGSVGGTRLVVADPARPDAPPLRIERLDASGIEYEHPSRLTIGFVNVRRPWAHVERDATGAITLAALFARRDAAAPAATPGGAAGPATEVTAGELRVQEGALVVVDGTRTPAARLDVPALSLMVKDATWPARRPASVALDATLAGGASLAVHGTIEAGPARGDLAVRARRMPLALASAYAGLVGTLDGVVDVDARVVGSLDGRTPRFTVTGGLAGSGLSVADPARPRGRAPLGAARLEARGLEYVHPSRLTVGRLSVERPAADLERDAAGALALGRLFARRGEPAPAPEAVAVRPTLEVTVGELRVQDGALSVVDGTLTPAPRIEVTALGGTLKNVTWPARGPAQVMLDATLGSGGTVHVEGRAGLDRRNAALTVTVRDLDVAPAQPYLPFRGVVQGRMDADLDVRGRLEPFRARVRGSVGGRDLALTDEGRQLLAIARVAITGIDYRAPARVEIADVHVVRPFALIERDVRGELSLRRALMARPRPAGAPAAAAESGGGPTPDIVVRHVLVEDGGTNIVDAVVEPAARFQVRGSRAEARNLTYPVRMPAEVALATPTPRGGRLEGRGTFQVSPGRMDVAVTLTEVALGPVRPYLPVEARVSGKVDGTARIAATFDPFTLSARGGLAVTDFALGDVNRELLTAARASAEGVDVQWPGAVRVARVGLERPWVLLEREDSGRLPLADLLRPRARAAAAPQAQDPGPRGAAEPLRLEIGTLSVGDGFGRFVDRTTDPHFAEELSAVNATVVGLGNRPGNTARTALRATLGPTAPLSINGQFGTIGAPLDLDVLFTLGRYPAPRLNPYLRTLFGWETRGGVISLVAHYRIEGDELAATNGVGMDGLQLVRPRDCCARPPKWPIGLPLDLFVSLLKDRHGHVELSLPVHGRLSSPEFDLGDGIWSALRGLAVKTVALPFALVGKLFFTKDSLIEALSVNPVVFEAGTATPAPGMTEHLGRLAEFLRAKPGIRLQLRPVLTLADAEPLKRRVVRERLAARAGDGSEAALREQALRVFARRYPKREAPATLDELLDAIAAETRAPAEAEAALAEQRITAVREALTARGTDPARLTAQTAAPAVETHGTGRVEFEITQ